MSQIEQPDQAALRAAVKALGTFDIEIPQQEMAARILRAFVAVNQFELSCLDHASPSDIVASAVWVWSEAPDLDAGEVAPGGLAGFKYTAFARVMIALEAMSTAGTMLNPDYKHDAFPRRQALHWLSFDADRDDEDEP